MSEIEDKAGQTPQRLHQMAAASRRRGDLAAMQAYLDAGLALDPGGSCIALWLLHGDVLCAAGRAVEAEAAFGRIAARHPGNVWGHQRLAQMARQRGDLAAARAHLDAGVALDPEAGSIPLWLLHGDVLCAAGRAVEAEAAFGRIAARHPGNVWGHQRLAQMARQRGDLAAARAHLDAALQADPERLNLQMDLVQLLLDGADFAGAASRLEVLRADHGPQVLVMLQLVRAYRGLRQPDRAEACLEQLIAIDPVEPRLLRHLFSARANIATEGTLNGVLDLVREALGEEQAADLEAQARLRRLEFDRVLQIGRRAPKARRSEAEALLLERALFGAHRYALHRRYLRFCLRRWPDSQSFWSAFILYGMQLGRLDEVEPVLRAGQGVFPEPVVLSHRLRLCAYRGDLDGAVACYARLQQLGQLAEQQRSLMAELIFNLADLPAADVILARIGSPVPAESRPLHRSGLAGAMTLEFELERRDLAGTGGHDRPQDWVRARPGSSMAAIRLIDAWRAAAPTAPPDMSGTDPVPRRIFQYWDASALPESIRRMADSWARAPGFEYRMMDRGAALAYLRETFGDKWVTAFRMARNPAQEADLLRLCLLAQSGGVWADADDYLYGDLTRVLGQGRGLILYRETLGGALGNNFMAAPAGHPAIVHAARMACRVLLERSVELSWTKTGPGLLTRAVGQYLVKADPDEARRQVTVLDWPQLARDISIHNPVLYKTLPVYWANSDARDRQSGIWDRLHAELRVAFGAEPGKQKMPAT